MMLGDSYIKIGSWIYWAKLGMGVFVLSLVLIRKGEEALTLGG